MKILILVSQAVLGGHVLSAFTIASFLKKRGHEIIFAGAKGRLTSIIEKEFHFVEIPIPFYHGSRQAYFTWKSFKAIRKLREAVRNHNVDIIHAFDARAYIHAHIAAQFEKKPITCTLCGGTDPLYNIPITTKIIVFSKEQRDKMIKKYRWKPRSVQVIPARVDVVSIAKDNSSYPMDLKLEPEVVTLMMISSFDGTKSESILRVMEALDLLIGKNIKFQMVFIGGKGPFHERIKKRAGIINTLHNRNIFIFTGPVINAYKLLFHADIVLGVGRSAFEAMALSKATIIVGPNGYAGVVSEQNIRDLAYYNFSGRNQKKPSSPEKFASVLIRLIENKQERQKIGEYGFNFVTREIEVRQGLADIEDVYSTNMGNESLWFKARKWASIGKTMVPIWCDNWWHTIGTPLKNFFWKRKLREGDKDEKV